MFAKLIKDRSEELLPENTRQCLEKLLHASNRMKLLITDILNYSRLLAYNIVFVRTALNDFISETLEDFDYTIRERLAIIEVGLLPKVDIISGHIRQVFQNLVSNVLKFSKPGIPPKSTITGHRVADKLFDLSGDEFGDYAEIRVRDNGIGFDKQFSANLFNLFQRLHSKDKFEGTVIDLAITKKIIDKQWTHTGI